MAALDTSHVRRGSKQTAEKAKGRVLLPDAVTPTRYQLHLTPDLEHFVYVGKVGIEVDVHEATNEITLHAFATAVVRACASFVSSGMDFRGVVASVSLPLNPLSLEFLSDVGLMEQVCIPACALGVLSLIIVGLLCVFWSMFTRIKRLHSQLDQSTEDAASLSEFFGSELERLRSQLLQSKEDSQSLDEMLSSILQGGLPGHLEMVSIDYWCVKTMDVHYTDPDGERQHWRQSGYHVNCFVPGGAKDVEVTFSVVGGTACMQVNRSRPNLPWVYDEQGRKILDRFTYKRCPCNVRFEISGPSLGAFVSHVTEVHEPKSKEDGPTERPSKVCT